MTTRQQKREKRSKLIHQLQRLEMQHQRVNGPDFIISQCKGCDICTQIRAIGEELSPSNTDICTESGLTIDNYFELRTKGLSDKRIAAHFMVSANSVQTWKKVNQIKVSRAKSPQSINDPVGELKDLTVQAYEEYRNKGLSLTQIADLHGCGRNTLYQWRKNNVLGDVIEGKSSVVDVIGSKLSVENYRKLKRAGTFDKEIRDMCGVSKSSFWHWKKKHGLNEKRGNS